MDIPFAALKPQINHEEGMAILRMSGGFAQAGAVCAFYSRTTPKSAQD